MYSLPTVGVKNVKQKNYFPAEKCEVACFQGPNCTSFEVQPEVSSVWVQSRIGMEKNIVLYCIAKGKILQNNLKTQGLNN